MRVENKYMGTAQTKTGMLFAQTAKLFIMSEIVCNIELLKNSMIIKFPKFWDAILNFAVHSRWLSLFKNQLFVFNVFDCDV